MGTRLGDWQARALSLRAQECHSGREEAAWRSAGRARPVARRLRGDSHASYFVGVYPPFLLRGLYLPRTPLSQENYVLSVSEGKGEWKALRMLPTVPKMRGVPKSWDKGWRHRPDATAVWEEDRKGPN